MTFKDQATADLLTFLNVNEFAETVKIDGDAVACVFEGSEDTAGNPDGIIDRDIIAYLRTSDFYKTPVVGMRLTRGEGPDARQLTIIGVNEEQGIIELRLRWLDS